uniref:SH2 domain-containing protein n=1 Tax=Mucochytrium quahogii TaxID=96639 RepID=A0A7S2WCW6_9STRA|mmetsp:Transcript_6152/g.9620  ORF Transcript_6152/g.9620 Transcript_6152/m.9620 type:complete len:613 (+) Transcript_6152:128-1966(+)
MQQVTSTENVRLNEGGDDSSTASEESVSDVDEGEVDVDSQVNLVFGASCLSKKDRKSEASVDVRVLALGVQRSLMYLGAPCVDLLTIERVLSVCSGCLLDKLSRDDFRRLLTRFGPLDIVFNKASSSIFDGWYLRRGYWGTVTRKSCEQVLEESQVGDYIIRFSNLDSCADKMIISYISPSGRLRHCGLRNEGSRGYSVHMSGGKRSYYRCIGELLDASPILKNGLACSWAESWNSRVQHLLNASLVLVPPEEDDEDGDQDGEHKEVCHYKCGNAPASSNIVIECSICNISTPKIDFDLKKDEENTKSPGGGDFALPSVLEALLRRGAENFRGGNRAEAEALFKRVIVLADLNNVFYRSCQVDEGKYRVFKSVIGDEDPKTLLKHDTDAAWCKCLSCSGLRAKARAQGNIGHILSDKKQIAQAVELYKSSLPVLREMGMWKQEPIVLSSLTTCAYLTQNIELGAKYGIEFMGTLTQDSERRALLKRLEELGALDQGALPKASKVSKLLKCGDRLYFKTSSAAGSLAPYGEALHLARCLNDDILEVNALIRIGCVLFMLHRLRDAVVHFERAVLLLRNNNMSVVNRQAGRARVELHNIALSFAKQATTVAKWS